MERLVPLIKNLDDPRRIRVGHSITRLAISIGLGRCGTCRVIRCRIIDQTTKQHWL